MAINEADLKRLDQAGYNRVAIVHEILADLDTPLSVYMKLAAGPNSYLLESAEGGEQWGRYSFIGLPASSVITVRGEDIRLTVDGKLEDHQKSSDPLGYIEALHTQYRVAPEPTLPRFYGGFVGTSATTPCDMSSAG